MRQPSNWSSLPPFSVAQHSDDLSAGFFHELTALVRTLFVLVELFLLGVALQRVSDSSTPIFVHIELLRLDGSIPLVRSVVCVEAAVVLVVLTPGGQ